MILTFTILVKVLPILGVIYMLHKINKTLNLLVQAMEEYDIEIENFSDTIDRTCNVYEPDMDNVEQYENFLKLSFLEEDEDENEKRY